MWRKILKISLIGLLFCNPAFAILYEDVIHVGDPEQVLPEAVFEVKTKTKSSVPCPYQTTAETLARVKIPGECIYNTDRAEMVYWDGVRWLPGVTVPTPSLRPDRYYAYGLAGISTNNLTAIYLTTANFDIGRCIGVVNDAIDGLRIEFVDSCNITGNFSFSQAGGNSYKAGVSVNPTDQELDEGFLKVAEEKILCRAQALAVDGALANCSFTYTGRIGDRIYFQLGQPGVTTGPVDDFAVNVVTGGSGGGGGGSKIIDFDGNTFVDTEQAPNENTIRFATDGVERMVIDPLGRVGMGTSTPNASAILDLTNTNQRVFVMPRLDNTQMGAVAGADGMQVFNTETKKLHFYNGHDWEPAGLSTGLIALGVVQADPYVMPPQPAAGYRAGEYYIVNGFGVLGAPFAPSVTDVGTGDYVLFNDNGTPGNTADDFWERIEFSQVGQIVRGGTTTDGNLMIWDQDNNNVAKDLGIPSANVPLMENLSGGKQRVIVSADSNKNLETTAYTIPLTDGTANQVLSTDGTGAASWETLTQTIVNDTLNSTSTTEALSANMGRKLNEDKVAGAGTSTDFNLAVYDGSSGRIIKDSGIIITDVAMSTATFDDNKVLLGAGNKNIKQTDYTFPVADGTIGQILKTDGAGAVSWAADSLVIVNDTLISTSTTEALSANQGRELQDTKVAGPATATDSTLTLFDGITGKAVKDSGILIENVPLMSANAGATGTVLISGGTDKSIVASTIPSEELVTNPTTSATNTLAQFKDDTGKKVQATTWSVPNAGGAVGQYLSAISATATDWTTLPPLPPNIVGVGSPPVVIGNIPEFATTTGIEIVDSGVAATDVVTRGSNWTEADRILISLNGTSRKATETGYTIPNIVCSTGETLTSDGTNYICTANPVGDVVGPGTATTDNYLVAFDGTTGRLIKQVPNLKTTLPSGNLVLEGIPTSMVMPGFAVANLNNSRFSTLRYSSLTFANGSNSNNFTLNSPVTPTVSYALTFPNDKPIDNQWLQSDATGAFSWVDAFIVEDVLTSTATTNALSANQGRVLDEIKVAGPATATDNALVVFDGVTGKLVKDSSTKIDDLATISADFTEANRVVLTGGSDRTLAETDFTFPVADGTADQVLATDGSGTVAWKTVFTDKIVDLDGNTSVNVEENTNEDKIRFKTDGVERAIINETGSMGIGTSLPHAEALLDLSSDTKTFLMPRFTTAQTQAMTSPLNGMQVYNTELKKLQFFNGAGWESAGISSGLINLGIVEADPYVMPAPPAGGYRSGEFYIVNGFGVLGVPFEPSVTDVGTGDYVIFNDNGTSADASDDFWERVEFSNVGQIVRAGTSTDDNIVVWSQDNTNVAKDVGISSRDLVIATSTFSSADRVVLSTGQTKFVSETAYTIPATNGAKDQVLTTDGVGSATWRTTQTSAVYTWKAHTLAAYSLDNLAVPYFTSEDAGNDLTATNCGEVKNNGVDGTSFTLAHDGFVTVMLTGKAIGKGYPLGVSINATTAELDASIASLAVSKIGCITDVLGVAGNVGTCTYSGLLKAGDMLTIHTEPSLTWINNANFGVAISCRK